MLRSCPTDHVGVFVPSTASLTSSHFSNASLPFVPDVKTSLNRPEATTGGCPEKARYACTRYRRLNLGLRTPMSPLSDSSTLPGWIAPTVTRFVKKGPHAST